MATAMKWLTGINEIIRDLIFLVVVMLLVALIKPLGWISLRSTHATTLRSRIHP
jgi:hypothetical protein